jgi:vacuolar-type H+-ATPase subunit D/Vma8
METKTTKKPVVKKTQAKKEAKSSVTKTETQTPKVNQTEVKKTKTQINMLSELNRIAEAYNQAIDGKIKFREVKEMFIKLHKDLKKTSK